MRCPRAKDEQSPGASAGSLDPYSDFVKNVPDRSGIAWVLIQHMAPDRDSHLSEILGRSAELPVIEVTEDTRIEPDGIYVIAPGRTMTVRDRTLRALADTDPLARRTRIDASLLSLAETLDIAQCDSVLLSAVVFNDKHSRGLPRPTLRRR